MTDPVTLDTPENIATSAPDRVDFSSFNLPPFLLDSLARLEITSPTPVQQGSIPLALAGKDVLANAQTGTGKTLAFLIPLLTKLQDQSHGCAIILTPTRELASQIKESLQQLLGRVRFNTALLIGGEPMFRQYQALKRHPRIIIGTPGRVIDHLMRGSLRLNEANFFVLDEADRMMDMGFSEALKKIADHLPKERQTLMFSATLAPSIIKLSHMYLNNPERVAIGNANKPVAKIKQEMIQTNSSDKFSHLVQALEERPGSVIIFVKTKMGAEKLADRLKDHDFEAEAIHGDLKQRRRGQVIQAFRDERGIRILVATDVVGRGLDIPHLKLVINYDLPQCPEDYIHRIGRTGRAGMDGCALSFISPDEKWKWKAIHNLIHADKESPYSGNRRSSDRGGRPPRRFNDRFSDRRGGEHRGDRGDRGGDRGFRSDRGDRGFRNDRGDNGDRGFRSDRGDNGDRSFRSDRGDRGDRGFRSDRNDRSENRQDNTSGRSGGYGFHKSRRTSSSSAEAQAPSKKRYFSASTGKEYSRPPKEY